MSLGDYGIKIGAHRPTSAGGNRSDIRLIAMGLVGALAGGLYTTLPYSGANNTPDEYLLFVNTDVGDVAPTAMESLAQTVIEAKRRESTARGR